MTLEEEKIENQIEKKRRTQFWIDCMLMHQRTDNAGYSITQSNIALKAYDELIKSKPE